MPVPTHFRFTLRGQFTNTPEEWSFGLKFSRDNPAGQDAGLGDVDEGAVTAAVQTWMSGANNYVPDVCRAIDWRMYVIGTDNRMEGNPLIHLFPPSPAVTGAVANKYPPQICCAVTTVGANRGPGRFGRFYVPTACVLDNDMRISANNANNIATGAAQLLKDISNAIDLELTQSSEGLNISQSGAEGARQTIDHVEVGRALDTLRNRRKSLDDTRVVGAHIDW